MEGFKAGAAFRKTKAAYFFLPEFDWFWKSCNGAQLVSSRLSDLAPTAALGSILRFKLKRGGLRCYGYSVFTLTAPTKPSTNDSIVVVESLSRIGETQKAFTGPSISSGCLWNTFDRENILLHLLPSVAGIHHFHVNDDFATFIHSEDNYKRIYILVFIFPCSVCQVKNVGAAATSGSTATSQPSHLPCTCRLFSNCIPRVERSENDSQRPFRALSHHDGSQILIESRDLNWTGNAFCRRSGETDERGFKIEMLVIQPPCSTALPHFLLLRSSRFLQLSLLPSPSRCTPLLSPPSTTVFFCFYPSAIIKATSTKSNIWLLNQYQSKVRQVVTL